jgi:hypothetical protein
MQRLIKNKKIFRIKSFPGVSLLSKVKNIRKINTEVSDISTFILEKYFR